MGIKDCALHGNITERLDKSEEAIKGKTEMATFKWVIGILLFLFVLYSGITLGSNSESHKDMRETLKVSNGILNENAKQLAVITDMVIRHVAAAEKLDDNFKSDLDKLEEEVATQKEIIIDMSSNID